MDQRNKQGRFKTGNKIAKKPLKCPYCDKGLQLRTYTYLEQLNENIPPKNGEDEL